MSATSSSPRISILDLVLLRWCGWNPLAKKHSYSYNHQRTDVFWASLGGDCLWANRCTQQLRALAARITSANPWSESPKPQSNPVSSARCLGVCLVKSEFYIGVLDLLPKPIASQCQATSRLAPEFLSALKHRFGTSCTKRVLVVHPRKGLYGLPPPIQVLFVILVITAALVASILIAKLAIGGHVIIFPAICEDNQLSEQTEQMLSKLTVLQPSL